MNNEINFSNVTDFTDNNNIWTVTEFHNFNKDDAVLDAHWGAEMTYDYFYQKHNRNSYDNNGSKIKNILVYDFTGRLVNKYTSKKLNLSSLSSSIYIIKVELITGEILTKKIIK